MSSTTTNHPWIVLSNSNIRTEDGLIYGVLKDRYILFESELFEQNMMYDIRTQTHAILPDEHVLHNDKCTKLKGLLFGFEKRNGIRSLCLISKWKKLGLEMNFQSFAVISSKSFIHIFDTETKIEMHHYNPPEEVISFAAVVVNDKIYIIGGKCPFCHAINPTVHVFDIATQSWIKAPPLPKALRNAAATAVMDRWIVVTGGLKHHEDCQVNGKIYIFDILRHQWSESKIQLLPSRAWHECLVVGCQLVCVGGKDESLKICPMEAINIKHIIPEWGYERIKHFILLRKLVDKYRATPIIASKKTKTDTTLTKIYENQHKVVQKLFTEMNLDVFRNVLSFL